jgi:hypothetical protein
VRILDFVAATLDVIQKGESLVSWVMDMISVATDAQFPTDKMKLDFIFRKMEATFSGT